MLCIPKISKIYSVLNYLRGFCTYFLQGSEVLRCYFLTACLLPPPPTPPSSASSASATMV